jgi:hypothetical protein
MDDVGGLRTGHHMDSFKPKMKVATQSCRPLKVAEVAKVADRAKYVKSGRLRCNFKVATSKLLQSPPFKRGTLQLCNETIFYEMERNGPLAPETAVSLRSLWVGVFAR